MVSSDPDTIRNIVGILGNIIALVFYLSPMPTFIQIWKNKGVEQYSPTPYLVTLVNCMVWVLYGLPMVHPRSLLVSTINGAGTAIQFSYIIVFLVYSHKRMRLRLIFIVIVELIFISVLTLLLLTHVHTIKKRSMIAGFIGIFLNTLMYASPLSIMKMVIKTKSVEYMPFFLSLASLANTVVWIAYALIRFDTFILISCGLGGVFALAQLILHAVFYKSTKRLIEARKAELLVVNGDSRKATTFEMIKA